MEKPSLKKMVQTKIGLSLKEPFKLPAMIKWNLLKALNNKIEKCLYVFYMYINVFKNLLCAIYLRKEISITFGS